MNEQLPQKNKPTVEIEPSSHRSVFLIRPFPENDPRFPPKLTWELESIIGALASHGFEVRLVRMYSEGGFSPEEIFTDLYKRLSQRWGVKPLDILVSQSLQRDVFWMRDFVTKIGKTLYIPENMEVIFTKADLTAFDIEEVKKSPLHEGGRVVVYNKLVLLPEKSIVFDNISGEIILKSWPEQDIEELKRKGYQVIFLPLDSRWNKDGSYLEVSDHIDAGVNILPNNNSEGKLVFSPRYLEVHRPLRSGPSNREKMAMKLKLLGLDDYIETDRTEGTLLPVGFLNLPGGKVLITGGAQRTKQILEKSLGKGNVLTTAVNLEIMTSNKFAASLRCAVGELTIYE